MQCTCKEDEFNGNEWMPCPIHGHNKSNAVQPQPSRSEGLDEVKYFIENTETQEWYANDMVQISEALDPLPNNSGNMWTDDPLLAMSFDSRVGAETYQMNNNLNYPKFKVTEHEFVSKPEGGGLDEVIKEMEGLLTTTKTVLMGYSQKHSMSYSLTAKINLLEYFIPKLKALARSEGEQRQDDDELWDDVWKKIMDGYDNSELKSKYTLIKK